MQRTSLRHCLRRAKSTPGLVVVSRLPAFQLQVPTFLVATQSQELSANSSVRSERADSRKEPPGRMVRGGQREVQQIREVQGSPSSEMCYQASSGTKMCWKELRLILSISHYATTTIRTRVSSNTFALTLSPSTRRSLHIQLDSMAVLQSTLTFTDEQISFAPDLEPAFEKLLRTLNVDAALITALKVNMINDRETFVGLDDTEAGFKNIAPDLGIDLVNGGLAHKREISRLISAWKHACIASETKHPRRPHDAPARRLDVHDVGLPDKVRKAYTG